MNTFTQINLTVNERKKLRNAAQIIHKIRERLPSFGMITIDNKYEITKGDLLNVMCTIYVLAESPIWKTIESYNYPKSTH